MRFGTWVTLAITAACGGVAGQPDGAATDGAQIDTAVGVDAPPPRCNLTAPFGTPVPLTALNTTSAERGARLSPDELVLYFSSNRTPGVGDFDLYIATRPDTSTAFSTQALLAAPINTTGREHRPTVTGDGLTLYADTGAAATQIEVATRATTTASFSGLAPVTELNSGAYDLDAFVLPDHRSIYFASDRTSGEFNIYVATDNGTTFDVPVQVVGTSLNTGALEREPVVTSDELVLYFSSDRGGGMGGQDIWVATRSTLVEAFGQPVNLAELNTASRDEPDWISSDGCVLYFVRQVGADQDLYYATRGM